MSANLPTLTLNSDSVKGRVMASGKQLKVAVVGSTGYAGSHVCIELLSRGHLVSGVSRNPDKIGTHPHYKSIPIDLETASIAQLVDALTGHDVVVKYLSLLYLLLTCSTYGPHTGGENLPYSIAHVLGSS